MFGSLSWWRNHALKLCHSFLIGYISLQTSDFIVPAYRLNAHSARGSKVTPKHNWTSSMFHRRGGIPIFESFVCHPSSSCVLYHRAHFHSDSDGWCNLKLLHLELRGQPVSWFFLHQQITLFLPPKQLWLSGMLRNIMYCSNNAMHPFHVPW